MPSYIDKQISPYSSKQLFALVMDIEKYPLFLPWCRAARILERGENVLLAELIIAFAHISESYVSKVLLVPDTEISVTMIRGPFEYLTNSWKFTEIEGGTQIDFALDFKFKSKILEKLIGGLFGKACEKMVSAFKARSDELYKQKLL